MGTITYAAGARPGDAKDVVGPSAAPTDGDIAAFDGVTGKLLKSAAATGSGSVVLATSPILVTPNIGVATATKVNKVTVTAPATGATLTLAEGSSLVTAGAYAVTFTATGATGVTLPTTGTLATLAGAETLTNKTLTTETVGIGASTAALGATIADAAELPAGTACVYPTTGANDTVGVKIHANDKVTGKLLMIGNGVKDKILKVYAPSGGVINGNTADAAFSSVSGKGVQIVCLSGAGNTWLAW